VHSTILPTRKSDASQAYSSSDKLDSTAIACLAAGLVSLGFFSLELSLVSSCTLGAFFGASLTYFASSTGFISVENPCF
jgi:hypothetical protein